MPVIAIAAIGAIGAGAKIAGGIAGANAQQGMATAQANAAAQGLQMAKDQQDKQMQLAAPTAQELSTIQGQLDNQTRAVQQQTALVNRDNQILSSLDPTLITAGQQANNLMKGQESAILSPMKNQQAMQRKQLETQLAQQYGPGYATSSAGAAALSQFDMHADMSLQQANMAALNQVTQTLGFGTQARTSITNEERMGFQGVGQLGASALQSMNSIQSRQTNAYNESSNRVMAAYGGVEKSAGSQYVGQEATANMISGLGSSLMQGAGSLAGGMAGGGGGAPSSPTDYSGASYIGDKPGPWSGGLGK